MRKQAVLLCLLCLFGCSTANVSNIASADRFRSDIAAGRFHQAYLDYRFVEVEMKDVGEDALGYEYQLLLDASAERGQDDWQSIFQDASIPLQQKQDLVQAIDWLARNEESPSK